MARHWFLRCMFVTLVAAVCLVVGYRAGAQDVPDKGAQNSLKPGEVMRVGSKVITSEQLIARMWDYEFMAQPEKRVLNDSLTYLRDTAVIELEAERLGGLGLTEEEITRETDRQVEGIRQMVKQDTHGMLTLEDWLKQQNVGMDLEGFRAYVRERAPIFITRRVLVRYFEATEPSIECKHILLKNLSDANEVHKKLKETPAKELDSKFEDLAVQRSIDPAAGVTKGRLPRIFENDGTLVKEAAQALWKLKDGEFSEPVKTDFGWHVFKRDRTLTPPKKTLKEMRDELMKQPDRTNENDYFNRWIRWVFNTRKYQYERRLPGFDCRPGKSNQEK